MTEVVYLIEATVYDPAIPGTRVLRYSSGHGYVVDGNYYEPRIKHPGRLKRMLIGEGKTSGPGQIGYGEVVLVNTDGALDALATYGFDGRQLMIKRGLALGALLSSVVLLAACGMEQATSTWDEVAIRIKDRKQELNVPLQANKYAGTNVLPAGVDGTADIQGKPKPLLFGTVKNATPVCVNTSKLIYQLHDGALAAVSGVYDKGIPLTAGAVYASQAEMEATAPLAGQYRVWLAGGMFRLGATPAGQVTADAAEGAVEADRSAAKLAQRLAARAIAAGDIEIADVTALHTLNSAVVGYYANAETTVAAALDAVLASVGGWYGFDALGKLRLGRLDAPAGNPVATLTETMLLYIERLPTSDEGRGLPAWRVNLGYDKNWSPGLVPSAPMQIAQWTPGDLPLSQEWSSIAYNQPLGLFLAVASAASGGGTTDKYATSPDGKIWTLRSFPSAGRWRGATGLGSIAGFLVVSDNPNTSRVTTDGINWTSGTLPSGGWTSVTFGPGLNAVAVNSGNGAATSGDAVTWTTITMPASGWSHVAYGNGLFIACNGTSQIATSPTGAVWTLRNLPAGATGFRSAWDGRQWLVIGVTGTAATSPDGVTWTQTATQPVPSSYGIASGDGVTVATQKGYAAATSDGLTWAMQRLAGITNVEYGAYGGGRFVFGSWNAPTTKLTVLDLAAARDRAQWLANPHRTVTASNSAIQTIHPLARELNVDTLIVGSAEAQAEANRLLALHKIDRVRLKVKVPRAQLPADLLGKPVTLQVPRYDYGAGKLLLVIGIEEDCAADTLTLDLWG